MYIGYDIFKTTINATRIIIPLQNLSCEFTNGVRYSRGIFETDRTYKKGDQKHPLHFNPLESFDKIPLFIFFLLNRGE